MTWVANYLFVIHTMTWITNNEPFREQAISDHLNTELVSYSDPHCIGPDFYIISCSGCEHFVGQFWGDQHPTGQDAVEAVLRHQPGGQPWPVWLLRWQIPEAAHVLPNLSRSSRGLKKAKPSFLVSYFGGWLNNPGLFISPFSIGLKNRPDRRA